MRAGELLNRPGVYESPAGFNGVNPAFLGLHRDWVRRGVENNFPPPRRPPYTLVAFGAITIALAIKAQVVSNHRHFTFDASVFVSSHSHFISSFSPGPLRGLSGIF
jgi:hypothetical protein